MDVTDITPSQRNAARVAGVTGLLPMLIVVFANYGLINPLMVAGNAAETARNIMAHQTQVRLALVGFLTYSLCAIIFSAAVYLIQRSVNHIVALVGALFRLVFAFCWLLSTLNLLNALRVFGTARYLEAFGTDQLQALGRVYLAGNFDDYYIGLPFFGLAATLGAYVWLQSGFIPRKLAGFGVIGSIWCVICAFIYLIFPNFGKAVNPYWFDTPMALFELVLSVWLLFKGLPANRSVPAQLEHQR